MSRRDDREVGVALRQHAEQRLQHAAVADEFDSLAGRVAGAELSRADYDAFVAARG